MSQPFTPAQPQQPRPTQQQAQQQAAQVATRPPVPQQATYQPPAPPVQDPARLAAAEAEYQDRKKSTGIMFALWFFCGALGAHRFYLGDKGVGVGMLLTLGGAGFWALADIFFIFGRLRTVNRIIRSEVFSRYGVVSPPAGY